MTNILCNSVKTITTKELRYITTINEPRRNVLGVVNWKALSIHKMTFPCPNHTRCQCMWNCFHTGSFALLSCFVLAHTFNIFRSEGCCPRELQMLSYLLELLQQFFHIPSQRLKIYVVTFHWRFWWGSVVHIYMGTGIPPVPAVLGYMADPQATIANGSAIFTAIDVCPISKRHSSFFLYNSQSFGHGRNNVNYQTFNILQWYHLPRREIVATGHQC